MKITTTTALFVALLFIPLIGFSQLSFNDPLQNRALHKLFTGEEIQALQYNEPERFEQINYYLTSSFSCVDVDCAECPIDPHIFFNLDLFNVFEHEANRLPEAPYSFIYREKYLITLHSLNDLGTELGTTISPFELIHGIPFRPLPTWQASGNDAADFETYKIALVAWKTDFPDLFRTLLTDPTLLRIRYEQFIELSTERRLSLAELPYSYLIVDDEITSYFSH